MLAACSEGRSERASERCLPAPRRVAGHRPAVGAVDAAGRSGEVLGRVTYLPPMVATSQRSDRVEDRRRAARLARHYRDVEELSIAEIARRLGRAHATVKAYLYDPTGEKARAVQRRYQACAAAAARRPPRATARATPTPAARPATPAPSNPNGRARACATRCAPGASATAPARPPMTGPHPRSPPWRRGPETAAGRRLARPRHRPLRHVGGRSRRRVRRGERRSPILAPHTVVVVEDNDEDGSQRFADLIPQTTAAAGRRRTARGPR